MGIVNGFINRLTQPADDENEVYDGADESSKPAAKVKPQPVQTQPAAAAAPQQPARKAAMFERRASAPAPAQTESDAQADAGEEDDMPVPQGGGIFSALGIKVGGGKKQQQASFSAAPAGEASLIIFKPATMSEARELRDYLLRGRQTIVSLDNVGDADARRILDYISGIAFAMDATVTQFSARSFIVAPANVDITVNGQA